MKIKITFLTLLMSAVLASAAPAPEQLLPNDTLAVFTVPDWDQAKTITGGSPFVKFWKDPSMQAFRGKFEKRWEEEVVKPMERDLGMKLTELLEMMHGQVTVAILKPLTTDKNEQPRWVMLMDSKESQAKLTEALAAAKKKWIEANKEQKSETVRDVEFTTYFWTPTNSAAAKPDADSSGNDLDSVLPGKGGKQQIAVAQSGSLMLAGANAKDFEKILARLSGGIAPSLAEVGAFERNANSLFRDSYAWAWADLKHFTDLVTKAASESEESPNPLAPSPGKIIGALGISDLTTLAMTARHTSGGDLVEFFVGTPAASRKGLLKLLSWEAKDAAPPAFVPSDTVKFSRSRLDMRKAWTTVETLLTELSPALGTFVQMGIENAGKDKDPNFDLRKTLINSLGDDLITLQKAPRSSSVADLQNPPSLYLLGSSNPDQLVLGIRAMMTLLPPPMNDIGEREFLGRKVFAVKMGAQQRGQKPNELSFARSGSYVAMSTDVAFLEEFLRNAESSGRTLRETPGLAEAAQQVGGMGTGWFSFENQRDQMRVMFDLAKNDPDALSKVFASQGQAAAMAGVNGAGDTVKKVNDWFDFKLLPEFAAVAKYFHFQLGSVANTGDGISIKSFFPTPPELK